MSHAATKHAILGVLARIDADDHRVVIGELYATAAALYAARAISAADVDLLNSLANAVWWNDHNRTKP